MNLVRGTKELQNEIKIALSSFKVHVKLNPNGSIAVYPRVSKEYAANVWTNAQGKEICSILNAMGLRNSAGEELQIYSGNISSVEGIWKIAP